MVTLRRALSRRQFLQIVGAAALGASAGCQSSLVPTASPTFPPPPTLTLAPSTSTPAAVVETGAEVTATSTASVPWDPDAQVCIAQQATYERKALRACLQEMLEDLGGLSGGETPILPRGAKVAIKVNLTGGVSAHHLDGAPAIETIATHPEVVRALGELLLDAGASQLFIVEAVYEWQSYTEWGYEEIAKSLNATLIDLNDAKPYAGFTTLPVGPGALIYQEFTVNPILAEVDTFISAAKMKCHIECGVTHSLKNLVGMVPYPLYRVKNSDGTRSAFHEDSKSRLPRIVVDLNMARPIHLALIDGIKTIEAGEGSWAQNARQVAPGLLIASRDPVAADSAATAIMGFDPTARYPAAPFTRADNYLNIAYNLDLGTNLLDKIEILGPTIEAVRFPFAPATGYKS